MNERPRASTDRNVSRETSGRRDKPSRAREGSSARHGRGEATREAEVDPRTLAGAIELAAQVIDQVVAGHNALEHYHALRAAHPVTEPGAWGRVRDLAWSALRDYGWGRWVLARLAPRGVPEPVLAPLLVALSALRDGPRDAQGLLDDPRFVDMRGVRVGQAKLMRCRPKFNEWRTTCQLAFNPEQITLQEVQQMVANAGSLVGIGDFRPRFGRFSATVEA